MNIAHVRSLIDAGLTDSQIAAVIRLMGPTSEAAFAPEQPIRGEGFTMGAKFAGPSAVPLLGYNEALAQAIEKIHPWMPASTWNINGVPHTTLSAMVDVMGHKSTKAFYKLRTYMVDRRLTFTSVGNMVATDDGDIHLRKRFACYETHYAPLAALTEACRAVFPRKFAALAALGAPKTAKGTKLRAVPKAA